MGNDSLSDEALADVAGDVDAMLGGLGLDPGETHPIGRVCRAATGYAPRPVRLVGVEGRYYVLDGRRHIVVHAYASPERQRWLVGHELGHYWYEQRGYYGPDLESRCDAFGAMLVAPSVPFRAAVKSAGHRVHALARAFGTTQALALLRLGEVTGRSVVYVGRRSAVVRGDAFAWPSRADLIKAVERPPRGAHPVKVDGRWGLMAR